MSVIRQLGTVKAHSIVSTLSESANNLDSINENVIMDMVSVETEIKDALKKYISDPVAVSNVMKIITYNYRRSVVGVVKKVIADSLVKI